MKNVKVYINSTTQTTIERFGVEIVETSVSALMTPAPVKAYITNKSALSHGKQVLTDEGKKPKVDERDVQLIFGLHASSLAQFFMRYRKFTAELEKGSMDIMVHIWEGSTYIKETYHLNYISCQQYSEFNGRLARFALKLNEPNPKNRVLEHSSDITL